MLNDKPIPDGLDRHDLSCRIRSRAAEGYYPDTPTTTNRDEELTYPELPMTFTKGLPHDDFGMVEAGYEAWVAAVNASYDQQTFTGFSSVPTGAKHLSQGLAWRGWESPRSGHAYDLQGPDASQVAMAPAPDIGSDELAGEMAEVYAMALLRDVPFTDIETGASELESDTNMGRHTDVTPARVIEMLNKMPAFSGSNAISADGLFRGSTEGAKTGPYISQFLIRGWDKGAKATTTSVGFGAQSIDLSVATFTPKEDYMTTWPAWLDVQQGADVGGMVPNGATTREMTTPRDLAAYVRIDALYQAYLVATFTLQSLKDDKKLAYQAGFPSGARDEKRASFATFGDPHILSLVTEVATRALKAVRRQKFNHHRRARPERLGAMLTLAANDQGKKLGASEGGFQRMLTQLKDAGLQDAIANMNAAQNGALPTAVTTIPDWQGTPAWLTENLLLPMAFVEGSPMHPAYGAGHATVAGACVTIIKTFFDLVPGGKPVTLNELGFQPVRTNGDDYAGDLTITGELDKLAANVSIGRNMAGVHFTSDYFDSVRMGERIAVGMVMEQLTTYGEPVSITLETFDGDRMTLFTKPTSRFPRVADAMITDNDGNRVRFDDWWQRHTPPAHALVAAAVGGK